jgi:TIGR00255 family protein
MTGYGKAEQEIQGKKITVELRSLNSKQLDLNVKLPMSYREHELELRADVAKKLVRGKADLFIFVETIKEEAPANINKNVFGSYYEQIKQVSEQFGISLTNEPVVQTILRMPDVLHVERQEVTEEEVAALKRSVQGALEGLEKFRAQEGAALIADILHRVEKIENLVTTIEPFEKGRIEVIKTRIANNIAEFVPQANIDQNRFEQELIFYVEKLDITEEKVRLRNHCKYFREICDIEEAPGRKLGFVAQEMGREINTLGSKANDADIQKMVVQMKDELEKIKEQVLNIL